MTDPVLRVRDLEVRFGVDGPAAVDGLCYDVHAGETLGIVGESGSGKTMALRALLRLAPPNAVIKGSVLFGDRDLLQEPESAMAAVRGRTIAMVFQDPTTYFNPLLTIGAQVAEAVRAHHRKAPRQVVRQRAVDLLKRVGIPAAEHRYDRFPHEYSGGMRQRAMIAMAIANEPELLLADEPTTALDVTVQAQILDLLRVAQQETGAATILVTHDLGVIAEIADRVLVMYAGRAVEQTPVRSLFDRPGHPYSAALLASRPLLTDPVDRLRPIPGVIPAIGELPPGCAFNPRCAVGRDDDRCRTVRPELRPIVEDHFSACHHAEQLLGRTMILEERR